MLIFLSNSSPALLFSKEKGDKIPPLYQRGGTGSSKYYQFYIVMIHMLKNITNRNIRRYKYYYP